MVQVYRVIDAISNKLPDWFGDFDDVVAFLKGYEEREEYKGKMTKKQLEKFNATSICDLMEKYGFTFQCIYDKD